MGSFSEKDMIVEIYSIVGSFLNRTKYLYWINVATFLLYFIDKLFSVMGCRQIRIPEWWLLFISGLGGAPSAMLAAWIFNHKTRKESFRNSLNFSLGIPCQTHWRSSASTVFKISAFHKK